MTFNMVYSAPRAHGESLLSGGTMYRSYTITVTTQHNASYLENWTFGTSTGLILIPWSNHMNLYDNRLDNRKPTNHAHCAVILARGKHPPTEPRTLRGWSEPRTLRGWSEPRSLTATQRGGDRASGASQITCLGSGKPPTRRNSLPYSPLLTVLPKPT